MTQTYILAAVSSILVILLIVTGCFGRHEYCPPEKNGISAFVYKAGVYIAEKKWFRRFYDPKVRQTLLSMHPADDLHALLLHYYAEKLQVCMLIAVAGFFLLTFFSYVTYRDSVLQDGRRLVRGGYTDEEEQVSLLVTDEEGSSRILEYDVLGRSYPDEEIDRMASRLCEEIEGLILSDNTNTSEIYGDLNLQTAYADYPFEVDWESSDYGLVDSDGSVKNDGLQQTKMVTLTAHLTYREKEWECAFPVMVHPRRESDLERWVRQARQQLRMEDEKSRTETSFILPEKLLGKEVDFRISNEGREWMLAPFCLALAILVFFLKDHDLEKELEKRREGIERSYPEFVGKFVLLFGAGLSVRGVLQRISEGEDLNEDLRLELKVLLRDLTNGISESEALTRFGKRLGSPLYIRFASFLIGNLKKGNADLLRLLQEEAQNAFILRKNHAKKMGEEASAKLLLPMFLMLGVVMAVIIMPAFMSL